MARWKIEPTWKKSLIERQEFIKDNKTITVETGWRWGEFYCETEDDTPPVIEEGTDLYSCGYDVEMDYCDDGCWEEIEFSGFTEEEEQQMREWLDENSWMDLTENEWDFGDCEMFITCEPSIEKVD